MTPIESYTFERFPVPINVDDEVSRVYQFLGLSYPFESTIELLRTVPCPQRPPEIVNYDNLIKAELPFYKSGDYSVGANAYDMDGISPDAPISVTLDAGSAGARIEFFYWNGTGIFNRDKATKFHEIGIGASYDVVVPYLKPPQGNIVFTTNDRVVTAHFDVTRISGVTSGFIENFPECIAPQSYEMAKFSLTSLANHTRPITLMKGK